MRLLLILCLGTGLFLTHGCAKIKDRIVDNEVQRAVDEQNRKLPADLEHGISLVRVDYNKNDNQIILTYTVDDRQLFNQHFNRIKFRVKKRVDSNDGLQRAFENGVQVFHEFRVATDDHAGDLLRRFESEQKK